MTTSFNLPNLPHAPGVYLMRNVSAKIIYVGKARDLKKRVASYFRKSVYSLPARTQALVGEVRHVDYVPTASEREALLLERRLIRKFKPIFNVMWKDDKSYPYVVLTESEDFPRLYLTRDKKQKKGNRYYGPYPSVRSVRNLLRWAWRQKLFPLRPCKFEFDEKNLLPYKTVKSCLYLHTGECPAPCIGKISSKKYKKISDRAKLFFEGSGDHLVRQWEKEMKKYSKNLEYEKAGQVRDRIEAVRHMKEHVTFREMSEPLLEGRVRDTRAIQELGRALHLRKPPETIECFDISHIQGTEKVASMVHFKHGRPDKAQYRKYIIKSVKGIDDFKSMAEVVGRRYRRLINENKPLPDLILIDGGKGQLSAALEALKQLKISNFSIAALAKAEEEVFVPGQSDPIRLPMDSQGLLLLRHVRDEAHRFAVTFHRSRRDKQVFLKIIDAADGKK